ncbi:MAG: DUF4446 family protein [Firmicutes bacterium]|nr:DUF4446 family protein [Bacillota bacterium]HQD39214.1 DUF4446 family protein [Bacillota bacterium]
MEMLVWLEEQLALVTLGIIGLLLLALIIFIVNNIKLQRLMSRYRILMKGTDGKNLEELIEQSLQELEEVKGEQRQINEILNTLTSWGQSSLQSVGMVRFDAFSNTGGEQSFSLAVADRLGNGFILTNLHGRDEAYFYAKPLERWLSRYALSAEEEEALKIAWEKIENPGKERSRK